MCYCVKIKISIQQKGGAAFHTNKIKCLCRDIEKLMAKKRIKKIFDIVGTVFLILSLCVLGLSIFVVSTTKDKEDAYVFGYKPIYVLSGSMEPAMMTDSVIVVKQTSPDEIDIGDIVLFKVTENGKSKLITHRIIDFNGEEVVTKGDNNKVKDNFSQKITKADIKAKVVLRLNWISGIVKYGNKDNGWVKIIAFVVAAIIAIIVLDVSIRFLLKMRRQEKEKKLKEISEEISEEDS